MTAERKELLIAALAGFKHTMQQLGEQMRATAAQLDRFNAAARKCQRPKNLSAEGRRRIIEGNRKRWAKYRAQKAAAQ